MELDDIPNEVFLEDIRDLTQAFPTICNKTTAVPTIGLKSCRPRGWFRPICIAHAATRRALACPDRLPENIGKPAQLGLAAGVAAQAISGKRWVAVCRLIQDRAFNCVEATLSGSPNPHSGYLKPFPAARAFVPDIRAPLHPS